MVSEKVLGYMEMTGETLVVIASALWITQMAWVPYVFACGAIVFAIGRMMQNTETDNLTLRRLYRQRHMGIIILLITAAVMFLHPGFYNVMGYNVHVAKSTWLITFIVFCIIEVYTAFRIPNVIKKG